MKYKLLLLLAVFAIVLSFNVNALCDGAATAPCDNYDRDFSACSNELGCWFDFDADPYCWGVLPAYDSYCQGLTPDICLTEVDCEMSTEVCVQEQCDDFEYGPDFLCDQLPGCNWITGFDFGRCYGRSDGEAGHWSDRYTTYDCASHDNEGDCESMALNDACYWYNDLGAECISDLGDMESAECEDWMYDNEFNCETITPPALECYWDDSSECRPSACSIAGTKTHCDIIPGCHWIYGRGEFAIGDGTAISSTVCMNYPAVQVRTSNAPLYPDNGYDINDFAGMTPYDFYGGSMILKYAEGPPSFPFITQNALDLYGETIDLIRKDYGAGSTIPMFTTVGSGDFVHPATYNAFELAGADFDHPFIYISNADYADVCNVGGRIAVYYAFFHVAETQSFWFALHADDDGWVNFFNYNPDNHDIIYHAGQSAKWSTASSWNNIEFTPGWYIVEAALQNDGLDRELYMAYRYGVGKTLGGVIDFFDWDGFGVEENCDFLAGEAFNRNDCDELEDVCILEFDWHPTQSSGNVCCGDDGATDEGVTNDGYTCTLCTGGPDIDTYKWVTPEICDGIDNNCDGDVDEGCPTCADPPVETRNWVAPGEGGASESCVEAFGFHPLWTSIPPAINNVCTYMCALSRVDWTGSPSATSLTIANWEDTNCDAIGGDYVIASATGTLYADYRCSDSSNNDGDGDVDYPNDPGCQSADDDSEFGFTEICNNNIDDDCNDIIDDCGCTTGNDCGANDCVDGTCGTCDPTSAWSGVGCSNDGNDYSTASAGTCVIDIGPDYICDYMDEVANHSLLGPAVDCQFVDGGSECDSDAGGAYLADGVCVNYNTDSCITGEVARSGTTYYDSCGGGASDGDECDDNVQAPSVGYGAGGILGICSGGTCVAAGSVANCDPCNIDLECASGFCSTRGHCGGAAAGCYASASNRPEGNTFFYANEQMVAGFDANDGEVRFYQEDPFGNVRAVANADASNYDLMDYTPFGERITYFDSALIPNLGYKGGIHDDDTGIIWIKENPNFASEGVFYDPVIARTLSAKYPRTAYNWDVQYHPEMYNLYSFYGNNPYKEFDDSASDTWTYAGAPGITSATNGAVSYSFAYEFLGQLNTVNYPSSAQLAMDYSVFGIESRNHPSTGQTNWVYAARTGTRTDAEGKETIYYWSGVPGSSNLLEVRYIG